MTTPKSALPPHPPLTELLLCAAAYRKSAILATAIEFKVFSLLSETPVSGRTDEQMAKALKLSFRSTQKLLGGLLAIHLIEKAHDSYSNTPTAEAYLVPGKELYIGDGLLFLKSMGEKTWSTLSESLVEGGPVGHQRTGEPDAEFWRKLTVAIRPFSQPVAESLCQYLKASYSNSRESLQVLDLAGGSGIFGQKILQNFPSAHVLQVDWPGVNTVAQQFAKDLAVGDRFTTQSQDLLTGDWSKQRYDVVILSHFIHQISKEATITLLHKIRSCLKDNGYVFINEYCLNPAKTGPAYGLIFALSMALQNREGDSYSVAECVDWMAEAGIQTEAIYSPMPPSTIVVGHLPGPKADHVNYVPLQKSANAPTSFTDKFWDVGQSADVEKDLLTRFKNQIHFAAEKVEFWKKRLPADVLKKGTLTRQDIEAIPLLFKHQIQNLSPFDLTPKIDLQHPDTVFSVFRRTGGTTGKPTGVFWTDADWDGSIQASVRHLDALRSIQPLIAWSGYNQAHVSGPAFHSIIRALGGIPIPRHFKATDAEAIEEIEKIRANMVILTPQSGSGKGGSLEDFLIVDPDFLKRLKIQVVCVSSTQLDAGMVEEIRAQGVKHIINFYGSTEGFPTGISCSLDPLTFHFCSGHIHLEIVDPQGKHVKSGENGLVVMSRTGSAASGKLGPSQGTQLIRYVVGDSATYIDEPCACGKTSPRFKNISRVKYLEDKLKGGCEKWE